MGDIGTQIKTYRESRRLTKTEMGKMLNVSSQLLGQYESGRQKPKVDFHTKWKEVFGESLIETNVSQGTEKELSVSSIMKIAQSNMILAEANKTLADAHIILARNNENLIGMVRATESVESEIPLAVQSKLTDLLGLIAEVGSGKRWKSPQEANAELHRRFVGTVKKKKEAGIRSDSGR